jgi:outer membrane immunogenic protein
MDSRRQLDRQRSVFLWKFLNFGATGFDPKGFLGGFHAGANWQAGRVVSGLEADLSFTDIKGSSLNTATPVISAFATSTGSAANSGHFDWLGSARGRLGYLVTPDLLLYGTGGLAWTRYVHNTDLSALTVFPAQIVGNFSSTSKPELAVRLGCRRWW